MREKYSLHFCFLVEYFSSALFLLFCASVICVGCQFFVVHFCTVCINIQNTLYIIRLKIPENWPNQAENATHFLVHFFCRHEKTTLFECHSCFCLSKWCIMKQKKKRFKNKRRIFCILISFRCRIEIKLYQIWCVYSQKSV